MRIIVSDEIESVCPEFVGAHVEIYVHNSPYSAGLWGEIDRLGQEFRQTLTTETLKDISGIAATRQVYRACGKDPSRYRPAAEALIRRILQGKQLYQINTLVDLVNLASIRYGYSIGGFDADKFEGDTLTLGVGDNTTHLVVLINGYDGCEADVRANAEYILQLACDYCDGTDGSYYIYK